MAQATNLLSNSYTSTYTSFSGCDIQAVLDGSVIGNLMGISYSVTREKAPIYCLGGVDPRGYSRGNDVCRVTVLKSGEPTRRLTQGHPEGNFCRATGSPVQTGALRADTTLGNHGITRTARPFEVAKG